MTINVNLAISFAGTDILQQILDGVNELKKGQTEIMATSASILTAQQKAQADLATLQGNVTALLTAFANETLTPADAQSILDNTNAEDTTATTLNASISAALNTGAPPAAGGPPAS